MQVAEEVVKDHQMVQVMLVAKYTEVVAEEREVVWDLDMVQVMHGAEEVVQDLQMVHVMHVIEGVL